MTPARCAFAALFLLVVVFPSVTAAQQPAPAVAAPLRVFVDCWECDVEFLRQNVTFLDYVRDPAAADLHVLVTTQSTGGGGLTWTVKFIGRGRFASLDRTHTLLTPSTATSDDRRRAFARLFRLAVGAYAADTAVAHDLEVTWKPPAPTLAPSTTAPDKWRRWVFRINGNGNVSGEKSTTSNRYSLSTSASRVTSDWRINLSANRNRSKSRFDLTDGRRVHGGSESWSGSGLVVKSLGPRLSAGGRMSLSHSSFSNVDRSISVWPGIEFDFFPYADYQRRSLTVWYEAGPSWFDYREPTVFDKTAETLLKHQVDVTLALRQPWGSLRTTTSVAQNLRYRDRYNASFYGSTDVRLFKGFSFYVYSSYSKIKDQTSLARADASAEEVLLRIRQLATNYRYSYGIGLSYDFGSVLTSIVNPRFSGPTFFFF